MGRIKMKKALLYGSLLLSIVVIAIGIYSLETGKLIIPFLSANMMSFFFIILFFQCLYLQSLKQETTTAEAVIGIKNNHRDHDHNDTYSINKTQSSVGLEDVAGLDEVKEEIAELIDFINHADDYKKIDAKIPKGILFYGPPGTGKTLLASAIAGETNITFLATNGSEFVEKYVGVGAQRIRKLYEKARKEAPAIVFIDEIDAIGCKRSGEGQQENNQALNQLLTEMDGFKEKSKDEKIVLTIAATNRLDILDEALLRPGRLDKHIYIGNPNRYAREEILKVHTKHKPLAENVDIASIAEKTHGLSGAHLSSIANKAAISAVRNRRDKIQQEDFDVAIERVIAGLRLKKPTVSAREKEIVAYHEAGHALVSKVLGVGEIAKVSIVPTGQALGYVLNTTTEDKYLYTKNELYHKIQILLGGRVAEEMVFHEITTGAKDDLQKSTNIVLGIICDYGMSHLGHRTYHNGQQQGNMDEINKEVNQIINECYEKTLAILKKYRRALDNIAKHLLEKEVITGEELSYYLSQNHEVIQ